MYVKEDIILPHTISFYDLIVNKAMGKSGPLFQASHRGQRGSKSAAMRASMHSAALIDYAAGGWSSCCHPCC